MSKPNSAKRKEPSKKRFVEIQLIEAKNLPVMDPNGLCDAFVRIFVRKEGQIHSDLTDNARSATKFKTRNPTWNEKIILRLDDPFQELLLQIEDEDISRNQIIGIVRIMVAEVAIKKAQKADAWFPILHQITSEPVTENSGDFPASKVHNFPSELHLCVHYVGDYYNEFDTLFAWKYKKKPPSAEVIFDSLWAEMEAGLGGRSAQAAWREDARASLQRAFMQTRRQPWDQQAHQRRLATSPGLGLPRGAAWQAFGDPRPWAPLSARSGAAVFTPRSTAPTSPACGLSPFSSPGRPAASEPPPASQRPSLSGPPELSPRRGDGGVLPLADLGRPPPDGPAERPRSQPVLPGRPLTEELWGPRPRTTPARLPARPAPLPPVAPAGPTVSEGGRGSTLAGLEEFGRLFRDRLEAQEPGVGVRTAAFVEAARPTSRLYRRGHAALMLREAAAASAAGHKVRAVEYLRRADRVAQACGQAQVEAGVLWVGAVVLAGLGDAWALAQARERLAQCAGLLAGSALADPAAQLHLVARAQQLVEAAAAAAAAPPPKAKKSATRPKADKAAPAGGSRLERAGLDGSLLAEPLHAPVWAAVVPFLPPAPAVGLGSG